jgi:hypothetical protein
MCTTGGQPGRRPALSRTCCAAGFTRLGAYHAMDHLQAVVLIRSSPPLLEPTSHADSAEPRTPIGARLDRGNTAVRQRARRDSEAANGEWRPMHGEALTDADGFGDNVTQWTVTSHHPVRRIQLAVHYQAEANRALRELCAAPWRGGA